MEEIWIIGVGQFGYLAFERLFETYQDKKFVLVDPDAEKLRRCKGSTARLEIADGIAFLEKHLTGDRRPDWIIPALPVHLAAEWLLLHLGSQRLRRIPLPANLAQVLPNPVFGTEGNVYVSHADFRCPADCDEPRNVCTITRKARKQNMFELLDNLSVKPFTALNIQSRQLGPGIGGVSSGTAVGIEGKRGANPGTCPGEHGLPLSRGNYRSRTFMIQPGRAGIDN